MNKELSVKVFDLKKGLIQYDDVKFIKVKSDKYNLLIFKNYMPIIGEINGTITIETLSETIKLENLEGYYLNRNNEFSLILKEN
ncbi:MAG: hypothetical protein R3Y21_01565 [Mycoplasmatota bacterium]